MNSEMIKQYLPVAKHALQVNAVLALYFIMPNFSSFVLTAVLVIVMLAPEAVQQSGCCEGECWSVNQLFQEYLFFNFTRSKHIIT